MDTTIFWKLIDEARHTSESDPEQQLAELSLLLDKLSAEEIVDFHYIFYSLFYKSYTWELWGAAYVINGGCSDDAFDYFRGWLISRGEKVFTTALREPDQLASMINDGDAEIDCQVEGWQSIAVEAWCRKTGQKDSAFPAWSSENLSNDPIGEKWQEEDLDRLYPMLNQRFN
ncbi:DUF4240 domain-containing protein [Pseudanabaena mucicola]|uniref:DUF4240 domain-containing protein n=1 Tax=Pseudanabaena mucicola FACHB-723 TaxID=2692860 RepID=A0ABR7ZZT5_9CYAN|nr:DUF4240 domain-containing protein [Pseudanabaena mucicola]MBD2189501.1 DUF4240 domain-containing protein [Pseudanabaena mucicola FACHB-723]